jgi:hypothetical protein
MSSCDAGKTSPKCHRVSERMADQDVVGSRSGVDSHLRVTAASSATRSPLIISGCVLLRCRSGGDRAGMPVGLQLTAPAGAEERLLAIALTAERGWAPRRTGSERRRCSLREIAAGSPSSSSLRSAKLPIAAVLRSRRFAAAPDFWTAG